MLFYDRVYIDDPNAKSFDIKDKHMPGNVVDNLKIALIQETEESSNGSPPKIYDLELRQHHNSHSETVCYLKVLTTFLAHCTTTTSLKFTINGGKDSTDSRVAFFQL